MQREHGVLRDTVRLLGRMLGFYRPWAVAHFLGVMAWASQDFVAVYIMARVQRDLLAAVMAGAVPSILSAVLLFMLREGVFLVVFSVGSFSMLTIQEKVKGRFQASLFAKLIRRREAAPAGDSLSRLSVDATQALQGASWGVNHICLSAWGEVGSLVVVFSVDWRLAVAALALGLGFMLIEVRFARAMRPVGAATQEGLGTGNQRLLDILAGALVIRLFGLAGRKSAEYALAMEEVRRCGLRRVRLDVARGVVGSWQGWLSQAGVIGLGCILVSRGAISLPDLLLAAGMVGQITGKMQFLSSVLPGIQRNMAGAARAFEALDAEVEDQRPGCRTLAPAGQSAVELRDVTYRYPGRGEPALSHFSLTVERGQTVALVGESGCGKTTLFRLILGMLSPDGGAVRLWGMDCRESALEGWRLGLAYLAQDAPLFDGTVFDNIRMGRLEASEGEILAAAEAAHAMEFVSGLPDGLASQAGELGGRLSGGQRQRIAIARALVRNAPILLLDEATSALDAEAEAAVQEAIDRLAEGRTVLVAAHRLSTIRHADRIVVLERGRVVEQGTHDALLPRGGLYTRLWSAQQRA